MSPSSSEDRPHVPIMVSEVLSGFEGVELKTFYEGTIGAGGHAKAILEAHPEIEHYFGCDRDPEALALTEENLSPWRDKVELIRGNFSDLDLHMEERGVKQVDGFFLT